MSLQDYWTRPSNREDDIYTLLFSETAERGYLTPYDIARALHSESLQEVSTHLNALIQAGCVTEIPKGSNRYRVKRNKPRAPLSSFTAIFICTVCGMEVYRHEHIKMRTEARLKIIKEQSRWAWEKHKKRVHHTGGYPTECWVNEQFGDAAWGIEGVEQIPEHLRASHFAREFLDLPPMWKRKQLPPSETSIMNLPDRRPSKT